MADAIDHCTGWFDAWWGEACCRIHDEAFAKGGGFVDFLASNVELGRCVAQFGDPWSLLNGLVMPVGTTVLGWIFWRRAAKARSARR